MSQFQAAYDEFKTLEEQFLQKVLDHLEYPKVPGVLELMKSIEYSLLSGGKRFRPVLSALIAEQYDRGVLSVLPWATALEFIHTYSLIHDDLPCMDNDKERRGRPTNHIVFGESTALLAGDALLTEAFGLVARHYVAEPQIAVELVKILSESAGVGGMVGGQALDMLSKEELFSSALLNQMHGLKTGALIRAACEGTAVALSLPSKKVGLFRQFGELLGLAFQIKDDLLDSVDSIEKGSYPAALGLESSKNLLNEVTERAHEVLNQLEIFSGNLHELVRMNQHRTT